MTESRSASCDSENESLILNKTEVFHSTQILRCTACFCCSPFLSSPLSIFNISSQNLNLPIKNAAKFKIRPKQSRCAAYSQSISHHFQFQNLLICLYHKDERALSAGFRSTKVSPPVSPARITCFSPFKLQMKYLRNILFYFLYSRLPPLLCFLCSPPRCNLSYLVPLFC